MGFSFSRRFRRGSLVAALLASASVLIAGAAWGADAAASTRTPAATARPVAAKPGKAKAGAAKKKAPAATTLAQAEAPPPVEDPIVAAPSGSSPMAALKKSHTRLQKLIGKGAPAWSPEGEAKSAEVRKIVNEFLDFQELAKRSLSRYWDGIPQPKRTAFVSTLQGLVERSYVESMGGEAEYQLAWEKETVQPSDAIVNANLKTKARGKPVTVALEYRMVHKKRGWVVYDVVTDEQSLLETYRAEFNKIIKKDSFDVLLDRMKTKLDEKKAGKK
jgi:phospholipid transport system substrate-binding protein